MIEQLQYEYENRIKSLEEKFERQKLHIEALQMLLKKRRQQNNYLKKQMAGAELFNAVRFSIQQSRNYSQIALSQLDTWSKKVADSNSETTTE